MAEFTGLTLTNAGYELQVKVQTGARLEFTRMALGDGVLPSGTSLNTLTALISEKQTVAIGNLTIEDGSVEIKANFSNAGLTESYYLRELGIFANDPDDGEILYAIANAGDGADYLPAYGGAETIEQIFTIELSIGNAANVTATFAESVYVLKAGDTMTGPLILSGNPTANLQAVTKQYVDHNFWDYYGTADPTTVSGITVKPMFRWADATNRIIKIRNFLNTAWISFMDMDTGNILTNAAAATNVSTSINGHTITGIFESNGTTVKNATTAANCTGNAATATTAGSCSGNSATATTAGSCAGNAATATNVTTNINGHAISSIFESNGTTVKNATIATNNYRAETSLTTYAYNGWPSHGAYTVFTDYQTSSLLSIINNLMQSAHKHPYICNDHGDNSDNGDYGDYSDDSNDSDNGDL